MLKTSRRRPPCLSLAQTFLLYETNISLQKVAVCFGGRALAGIFLHMCRTGVFAGMPDLTLIRALKPDGKGGLTKVSAVKHEAELMMGM